MGLKRRIGRILMMRSLYLSLGAFIIAIVGNSTFSHPAGGVPLWRVPGGNSQEGREAVVGYGCSACHVIKGIRKATGRVGPKLLDIRRQIYIGGVLPNSPGNMIQWIRNPRRFSPETAMPNLEVTEQDARNIASHLYDG